MTVSQRPLHRRGTTLGAYVVLLALLMPAAANAQVIGIDFVGSAPTAMGAGESAGVVAKTNWNSGTGASRATPLALKDETGAATTATATWSAAGAWMTPITDQTGNRRLMKGYLDSSNTSTTTVTVAGLPATTYDIYVYADGDNGSAQRTAAYTISGSGITTTTVNLIDSASTNFNTAFTQATNSAGNYVKFSITAAGFTISTTPGQSSDATQRAPLNGIQIVPTAPPGPDFTVAANPASRTVAPGANTTFTVSIAAMNGFAGNVGMSVTGLPAGTSASFNPTPVAGAGDTTLTVTTSAGTPTGTSTLTVTGTSGALTHSSSVTLFVNAAQSVGGVIGLDFVGSAPMAMGAAESAGVVAKTNWNSGTGASRATPLALKDETGAATNATATWSAAGVWMTPITDQAGNSRLMKGYLDSSNTSTTTVTVAGLSAAAYDIYVYADGDNGAAQRTAAYTISGSGITTTTVNLIDSASTNFNTAFTQGTNSAGNYVKFSIAATGFTISGTPVQSSDATPRAPLNGIQIVPTAPPSPDFTVATSPGSQTVTQGGSTSYTVNVGALNGFNGQVTLGVTGLPSQATGTFTPPSVTGGGMATLDVTTAAGTPFGSSTLTVTGTSGALSHASAATLMVSPPPDFTMATSPASRSVNPGGTVSYTVTIGALNGFNGPVSFGATGLPANASATFTPPTVTGAGTTTLNVTTAANTPLGTSTLTITGTSGALNHTATTDVVVTNAPVGGVIGLDFVGSAPLAMGAAESAGVVAKTNWNSGTGASRATPLALKDETGAATNATATWSAAGVWMTPVTDQAGNRRLMKGYLDSSNTSTTTLTVAGLAAAAYDIYVYADGDNGAAQRTAAYTISGAGITTTTVNLIDAANTNFNTAFTQATNSAGNYVKFSITASGFTISATPVQSTDATLRAPLNGIQIVPTGPPPPTYALSGTITPAANGASASVNLGGAASASTTANASGVFTFTGLQNGNYLVSPGKPGYTFNPSSRNVTIAGSDVTGVDFTATQSPLTVSITSPSPGSVSNAFTMTATTTGPVVGVQFRVDGVNVGAEDTASPYSVPVTVPMGSHTLTAIARDAVGNNTVSPPVNVTAGTSSGTALALNGAQIFQTMDGLGVNMNSLSWKNGELQPALDMLIDQMGTTTFRVIFDMEDWEDSNDNNDPALANWTYYNALYSNAKFQNLWGTLHYLNQKGISTGIVLSFMGRVPTWMGGVNIKNNSEDEWAEMIATLLYYARNTEHVDFSLVDPLNETDWDGIEGPQVGAAQYVQVLHKLALKLDAMNIGDFKFVGPNTANISTGVGSYLPALLNDPIVMAKMGHFGFHDYSGSTGGADAAIKASSYPTKNFWMTEGGSTNDVLAFIGQNAASVQWWEAYDSVYNHAILAGRGTTAPNDDCCGTVGLLAYNSATGTYTKRGEFNQMQTFKYVSSGAVRIGANQSNGSLTIYAFRHPTTGRVTIVGRNTGSAVTINGTSSVVGALSGFQFYQTSGSDSYNTFVRGADAVVTNGAFVFTAPANSYFTLVSGQ